jgi:hypothetical protein
VVSNRGYTAARGRQLQVPVHGHRDEALESCRCPQQHRLGATRIVAGIATVVFTAMKSAEKPSLEKILGAVSLKN